MENKSKWEKLVRRLEALLRLKTFPVAIKLLEDSEELSKNRWVRRPDKRLTLCQLISIVRTFDWTVGVTADDLNLQCASIVGLVGFNDLPEEIKDGTFRSLVWCNNKQDGEKSIDEIAGIFIDIILHSILTEEAKKRPEVQKFFLKGAAVF